MTDCDFAFACDLRILHPDAELREGFVRVGLVPGDGGEWLLPRLIGEARAWEYLLTVDPITPADAEGFGLEVELATVVTDAATDLADHLLTLPATALSRTN